MRRVLVIYNPNSSQYVHVKDEVLARLGELKGCAVGKFAIQKVSFDENVKRLEKLLRDGDFVLTAGGDATAAVTANAIVRSGKDVMLAVLPYGNFNDLARTLKMKKMDDILTYLQHDKSCDQHTSAKNAKKTGVKKISKNHDTNIPTTYSQHDKLYPLEIWVDGKLWRYATCYVTMGMTAEAVELFDDKKVRKELQKGRKSSWRSYLYLMKWYFKNRRKKVFVPPMKLNGKLYAGRISDYAALSGTSMCRVMRGRGDFEKPKVFVSKVCYLIGLPRLTKLMMASILCRFPGRETRGDVIEFVEPATVELQAEGEYQIFENVKCIEVRKINKPLKVLRRKNG